MSPWRRAAVARLDASPGLALALAAALLAAVGVVHHALGRHYSLALLYILPIVLAARFAGRGGGLAFALLAGAAWFLDDYASGAPRFAAAALMVAGLERDVTREHRISLAKSDMIALVSHQFSNTLTTMELVLILLEEQAGAEPAARRRELHAIMRRNIETLKGLVLNFLNEARLASGHFAIAPAPTDLGEAFRRALAVLQPMAAQKGQTVVVDAPPGGAVVRADPDALNLVLTNLLGNAVKYTGEGGRIEIGARREAGGVRAWVEDNGIGMTTAEAARALAGERAEGAKRVAKGFGLGLRIANEMLLSHGSRLDVESVPGKGSRFSFVLKSA